MRETWYLTLKEGHTLREFETNVLDRIFSPKRGDVTEGREKYVIKGVVISTLNRILLE